MKWLLRNRPRKQSWPDSRVCRRRDGLSPGYHSKTLVASRRSRASRFLGWPSLAFSRTAWPGDTQQLPKYANKVLRVPDHGTPRLLSCQAHAVFLPCLVPPTPAQASGQGRHRTKRGPILQRENCPWARFSTTVHRAPLQANPNFKNQPWPSQKLLAPTPAFIQPPGLPAFAHTGSLCSARPHPKICHLQGAALTAPVQLAQCLHHPAARGFVLSQPQCLGDQPIPAFPVGSSALGWWARPSSMETSGPERREGANFKARARLRLWAPPPGPVVRLQTLPERHLSSKSPASETPELHFSCIRNT